MIATGYGEFKAQVQAFLSDINDEDTGQTNLDYVLTKLLESDDHRALALLLESAYGKAPMRHEIGGEVKTIVMVPEFTPEWMLADDDDGDVIDGEYEVLETTGGEPDGSPS